MNKLSFISTSKNIFYNVGLSKLSSEVIYNFLDCTSYIYRMIYKYKNGRCTFNGRNTIDDFSKFNKVIRFEAHSNCHSIEDCDYTGSRFFRRK